MTVHELIKSLEEFDPMMEVSIGMVQRYGSNFAMTIEDVSVENVDDWDYGDTSCVVITEGRQFGSVAYDDEYDE